MKPENLPGTLQKWLGCGCHDCFMKLSTLLLAALHASKTKNPKEPVDLAQAIIDSGVDLKKMSEAVTVPVVELDATGRQWVFGPMSTAEGIVAAVEAYKANQDATRH